MYHIRKRSLIGYTPGCNDLHGCAGLSCLQAGKLTLRASIPIIVICHWDVARADRRVAPRVVVIRIVRIIHGIIRTYRVAVILLMSLSFSAGWCVGYLTVNRRTCRPTVHVPAESCTDAQMRSACVILRSNWETSGPWMHALRAHTHLPQADPLVHPGAQVHHLLDRHATLSFSLQGQLPQQLNWKLKRPPP
jgi:hypothetical protein